MKITIDEHIEVLKSYHHGFTGCASNLQDSIDVAVDIMCKYQKMQKVLERIWNIPGHLINKKECLDRIMETYREVR